MFTPRLVPLVRGLLSSRSFTPSERVIARALASIPVLDGRGYEHLCAALPDLGRDAIHDALSDLLIALTCEHDACECLLRRDGAGDPRDREAIASLTTAGEDGSLLLARAFGRWCWRHWRKEVRRELRECDASGETGTEGGGAKVATSLDQRAESEGLHAPGRTSAERCEEHVDATGYGVVLDRIFSESGCTEREADAYLDTESRRRREFGNALPDRVRTAASRARRTIRAHLRLRGILDREDLNVAIEEGEFREEYRMTA